MNKLLLFNKIVWGWIIFMVVTQIGAQLGVSGHEVVPKYTDLENEFVVALLFIGYAIAVIIVEYLSQPKKEVESDKWKESLRGTGGR